MKARVAQSERQRTILALYWAGSTVLLVGLTMVIRQLGDAALLIFIGLWAPVSWVFSKKTKGEFEILKKDLMAMLVPR